MKMSLISLVISGLLLSTNVFANGLQNTGISKDTNTTQLSLKSIDEIDSNKRAENCRGRRGNG